MADPVRDAQSEAPAKERCSNKTSKRRRQNGVATEQSERAPTIASNLQELFELCDRVLPLELYSAKSRGSNGSNVLLPLLQISEAYRTHLRDKDVTAADALSLPPNMRTTGGGLQQGHRTSGCRHQTAFFVGPAPQLLAMDQVLRELRGTTITINDAEISAMLASVEAKSAAWKQTFVEAPTEVDCMVNLKRLGFLKFVPAVLSANVGDDEWASLSAAPTRVAPEQPATQESIHDNSSAGRVDTLGHIQRICASWKTPAWKAVRELFDLFEKASLAVAGSDPEPPIRLWVKVRGLGVLRSRLSNLGLQYINLTEMVQEEMSRAGISRMQAIENVDQRRKKSKKLKTGGGDQICNAKHEWTIRDIERPPPGTTSHEKDAYFETAKKLAEAAVGANDIRGAESASTGNVAS
jgi:hypothetical protein